MLSALGALGAVLGLSWALLGALETLLGAILSDQRALGDVLACSWEEVLSKDGLYVRFLLIFNDKFQYQGKENPFLWAYF